MKRATILIALLVLIGFFRVALYLLPSSEARRAARARREAAADKRPYGIGKRVAWTTSKVTGSPEPPPPYRSERVFPKLQFDNPLLLTRAPGTNRLFVGEQAGKLYSFPNDPACARADLFLDLTTELQGLKAPGVRGIDAVYGLTFHPQFVKNRYCYVCYVLDSDKPGQPLEDGSRVSRFRVSDTNPPRCEPKSEQVLITWRGGGHNGGCLEFGKDGYLYISTGDGSNPNPPDALEAGQDLSRLLSKVLRIDVDHSENGKAYAVPQDNPFVKTPGARPETWAYGFRNPWRMGFDQVTGDLWVGDVGWELWEMVYRVQRGGNYGWSVMEGPQPVRPNSRRGPTPILPPNLAFPHTEGASITGGYVYRGKRLPELVGAYICGDWVTRKLWGTRFDGDRVTWHKELAQTDQRVVAFGQDHDGELYWLHYDKKGTIHRLVRNENAGPSHLKFPRRLSETGLFTAASKLQPAPGVIPFSINTEQWLDHATAERLLGLPGTGTVRMYDEPTDLPGTTFSGKYHYPKDGVLAKTISLEMERGNPASRRRLETQLLHFDGQTWHGYTYEWNEQQTDATLVEAAGKDREVTVKDTSAPGGTRKQRWHYPSRAQCLQCHNPWADYALAFTPAQLNRDHLYGTVVDNQVRTLEHAGVLSLVGEELKEERAKLPHLSNPYDASADLNERARSYLHVNCSHCHQFGAGGTADIELRYQYRLERMKALEVPPVQGTFAIKDVQILAPGDPYRSVLYYRMAKLGTGRMPHIGSEIVDEAGLRLMHDWIRQLPVHKDERALVARLEALDEQTVLARERKEAPRELKDLAETIAKAAGREDVQEADREKARTQLQERHAQQAKARVKERVESIERLLQTTTGALVLLRAVDSNRLPPSIRVQALAAATTRPDVQVRDLFERFLPDSQRVKRLGSIINAQDLLARKGDVQGGRDLFFSSGVQCMTCHRIGDKGGTLGPDLTKIGMKLNRAQILESILEPSKTIEQKYVAYVVETTTGQAYTGLLAGKTKEELVLRTAQDKEVRIPAAEVATLLPQRVSLMPEMLIRDLTAEQAADLLAFLESLK